MVWHFHSAGSIVFGRGAVDQLGAVAGRLRLKRVAVVADGVLASAGIVAKAVDPLRAAGVAVDVFEGGQPEPTVDVVRAAVERAATFGPDGVVGLGGGSNMDVAKLAALVLAHGGDPTDYTGENRVPGPVLPLVCVPTTAGTGSEVSPAAVFTDTANKIKVSCLSWHLRPAAAVVDPLLTVSCPPKVTADSGIDALTHAIEAFTATHAADMNPPPGETPVYQGKAAVSDLMAAEAIRLVGRFLRRAVQDGDDLEARDGMALAATLGGLAFSNAGVALVHAMEYPVGGAVHVSHGAGNGLLLPFVARYNLAERPAELAEVGRLLGVDGTADAAIAEVERLRADIGIPLRLRDIGVTADMLPGFAGKAFGIKRLMRTNPRHPQRSAEILEIYRAAF